MSETLTLGELAKRLKKRKEEELKRIEQIEKDALKSFIENLKHSTITELNIISADIGDRRRKIERDTSEMSEAIEQSLNKTQSEAIKRSKALREELTKEIEELREELKIRQKKRWIYRLIVPTIMVGSAALGTWGLSAYLSSEIAAQIKRLEQLKAEAKKQKATMNRYVVRSWSNAIGVKRKPHIWRDNQTGLWIVQLDKEGE